MNPTNEKTPEGVSSQIHADSIIPHTNGADSDCYEAGYKAALDELEKRAPKDADWPYEGVDYREGVVKMDGTNLTLPGAP